MIISGFCDPRFARVGDEFAHSFATRGEVGAAVCVTQDGETVLDLWGGTARPDTGAPWQHDTVTMVFSCTKAATALCAHILAERGDLDLDAPVAQYWPRFGQGGKECITVKMLLNHQSGLPAIRKPVPTEALYDWDTMVAALEGEAPFWEPGTRHGYQALTFGWLVGEVVRCISGQSLGAFFRDHVAAPLGLDFWIGLPEEIEPRVAPTILADPPSAAFMATENYRISSDPTTLPGLVGANLNQFVQVCNTRAARAAEIPGANGITHARGLAGLFAPLACGGNLRGVHLANADTLARLGAVSSATGRDASVLIPLRLSLGMQKAWDNRRQPYGQGSLIMSEEAFGHSGMGGSLGFADPKARLSFGYVMNKQGGEGAVINERGQSLVDAVYLSLGYRSNASGVWV